MSLIDAIERMKNVQLLILAADYRSRSITNAYGTSALGVAAMRKNTFAVKTLLKKGWDVNFTAEPNKYTPLHVAARYGTLEIVKMLLSAGALLEVRDAVHKWTPLQMAATKNRVDVTKVLIEAGARVQEFEIENSSGDFHDFLKTTYELQNLSTRRSSENEDTDSGESTYATPRSSPSPERQYPERSSQHRAAQGPSRAAENNESIYGEERQTYNDLQRRLANARRQQNTQDQQSALLWQTQVDLLEIKIQEEYRRMNERSFGRMNSNREYTLDLHCLDTDFAVGLVRDHIGIWRSKSEIHTLKLITGQGRHSRDNKASIRSAVLDLLKEENLLFDIREGNMGVLYVSFPQ